MLGGLVHNLGPRVGSPPDWRPCRPSIFRCRVICSQRSSIASTSLASRRRCCNVIEFRDKPKNDPNHGMVGAVRKCRKAFVLEEVAA